MTQDEIIEMTEQAGMLYMDYIRLESMKQIEALIKLATAKEREACAKVCELIDVAAFGGERPAPNDCAAAIRARAGDKHD